MEMCTYWSRQRFRDSQFSGFGYDPRTEKDFLEQEEEDDQDPPCETCAVCVETADA